MATNEHPEPSPSAEFVETSPQLPALTNDGWELVQYRLWDKLRGKMWASLSGFLTLVTLAGLLGIPAYIRIEIEEEIKAERAKFEQIRADLAADQQRLVAASVLTSYLALRWNRDLGRFRQLLLETHAPNTLNSNQAGMLNLSLADLERFLLGRSLIAYEVRVLTAEFSGEVAPKMSTKPLTRKEWLRFREVCSTANLQELPELFELYSHLLALESAIERSQQVILDPSLRDPSLKVNLYEQYETIVYPTYYQAVTASFSESEIFLFSRTWRLDDTASLVFLEDEKRLRVTSGGTP